MKRALARLVLGPSVPQYAVVGIREPQTEVRVRLHGFSESIDVTRNNVVASLRPFQVAVTLPEQTAVDVSDRSLRLTFHDLRNEEAELGSLHLKLQSTIELPGYRYCIFRPTRYENRCMSPLRLRLHYLYRWLRSLRPRDAYNFRMSFRDLHRFWVFYTCPRPVALITVRSADEGNLFPMDLIGPTNTPYFSLALRNTSPAVDLIKRSREIAVSRIPVDYTSFAYQLGVHHRKRNIDWDALPFEVRPSITYGLPVPKEALGISELWVDQAHTVGSHTVFLTTLRHDESRTEGLRMCHVQGFFHDYRRREGPPL